MSNELIPRSFWERKEGLFGMGLTTLMVFGLGYGALHMLPYIIIMLSNTILTIALSVALFIMVAVLSNGTFQAMAWNVFKSITRGLASLFVTVDPEGIVRNHIDDLKDKRDDMNTHVKDLRVNAKKLLSTILGNEQEIETTLRMAKKAELSGDAAQFRLTTRKAGRRQNSVAGLRTLYDKMEYLLRILEKIHLNSGYKIEDLEDEVNIKTKEFQASKGARSAISSALYLLKGDRKRDELFEMSMDHMADQVDLMLGELDDMMFVTNEISASIDLENGMFEDKGFAMLEKLEQNTTGMLITQQELINLK